MFVLALLVTATPFCALDGQGQVAQPTSNESFPDRNGTVSPTGPSRRRGYEITANLKPVRWLAIDAVYATNHARFVNAPGVDRIPNALEGAGEFGLATIFDRLDAALRVR